MNSRNDLEAAFRNITGASKTVQADNNEKDVSIVPQIEQEDYMGESGILLKKREKEELRNVRKQFAITETLNNKLKSKSKELGMSENEIIIQLLTYM